MEEEILEEALKYFKSNDGFIRFFEKMKKKLEMYEKEMTGTVIIENPTNEEKDALSGFMKQNYRKSKTISIKIGRFQTRLNETKFEGVKVKELVKKYFGVEILTKKTRKEILLTEMREFFEELLKKQNEKRAYVILKTILEENKEEYSILKAEFKNSKTKLKKSLENACHAINNLPDKKTLLPVFAAEVLKNPHELDKNTLTGRLFILMLSKENETARPHGIEELAEFYYNHNLLIDELSNMILCKNIIGIKDNNPHPGWLGFFENNEAMQITLAQLSKINCVETVQKNAIIVENPAVFSVLSNINTKVPFVCTYGQVKLSGKVLLDLLVQNSVELYYSGDIDPEGIQIADKLKKRYGEKIKLVGFEVETYLKNLSKVTLSKQRIKKLDNIEDENLIELSSIVKELGVAAYEEKNIDTLVRLVESL